VKKLSVAGKLLFNVLCANVMDHVSGLYFISPAVMSELSGIPVKNVLLELAKLEKGRLVFYDHEREVVFVRSMLRINGPSPKIDIAVTRHLRSLHNSKLIPLFLEEYSNRDIRYQYRIDTVSHTVSEGYSIPPDTVPVPVLSTVQVQEEGTVLGEEPVKLSPIEKKKAQVQKALDAIDLVAMEERWAPEGVPVSNVFAEFCEICLEGTAKKPLPNPYGYRDFRKALDQWCKKRAEEGPKRSPPSGTRATNGMSPHDFVMDAIKDQQ
jgi:hypothetical protein